MRVVEKTQILIAFCLVCLFLPECVTRSLTAHSETAVPQTSFLVEVDSAGQIKLNGQKIGILDEPALLGVGLQEKLKSLPGRAIIQLRFSADATWGDFIGIVYVIEASAADEIQIQDPEDGKSLVTLRKRKNPAKGDLATLKPNPLTLVVGINSDGVLSINSESLGQISNPSTLTSRLEKIFKDRETDHAYKPGLETRDDIPMDKRIEKTVFVKASRSQTAGHVLKLIALLKSAGAHPVGLQLDDLPL